ncbi:MAG: hypothetical protein WCW17_01285 [Patescibacteria group bacterium]|jgi:hypothetical protein
MTKFFKKIVNKINPRNVLYALIIPESWKTSAPINLSDLNDFVSGTIVGLALNLAGFVALFFVFLGGYMWITSSGDTGKIEQGKKTLIYALAGFVLVLVSGSLVKIVVNLLT